MKNIKALILLSIIVLLPGACLGESLEEKAEKKVIKEINLEYATMQEAVAFVSKASGIPIVYIGPKNDSLRLKLELKDIPTTEAVRYIAELSGSEAKYGNKKITITKPEEE